jgi:hypothetical protein
MKDYVKIFKHEKNVSVCFYIESAKVITIGDKMNEINELAYMNGYNWDAFFNYYLKKDHPEVFEEMESDPEAGTYVAYYDINTENEKKAEKLASIIENLVENEQQLYDILKKSGDQINWD